MSNDLCPDSARKRRKKITEVEIAIKEANSLYIQNNLDQCIDKARDVLSKFPRSDRAYFLLGLVFEEKKDIIKAYNFYMIAAQLMKNNYALWYKLYTLADNLRLFSDKLYFLQIIQRYKNSRELVVEKTELFNLLKNKYKVLECKIELFEFDGVDFDIFEKIRSETKHKYRTSVLALLLIRYYKKNMKACGLEYLMNCVRLQYESGYLIGTKNLIEEYIFPHVLFIPNDIRIIYVVCCLADLQPGDTTFFKSRYETVENTSEQEITYENLSERIMSTSTSIFSDLHRDGSYTKTLRLDTFEQEVTSGNTQSGKYDKYANLDIFLTDVNFWNSFNEEEQIKKLVEVLVELKMFQYAKKLIDILLKKCENLQEFCNYNLGEIHHLTNDNSMAALYFENVLKINPDNHIVKSKLYDVYSILGNKDMQSYYKTVNSLINYVDDINNKDKEKYRFSIQDCLRFRELYCESRRAFEIDDHKLHIKIAKPLVEDFLGNEFIFISTSKFKTYSTVNDRRANNLKIHTVGIYDKKSKTKIEDNLRYLSLHGLDTDEWFYLLLEFIISKIKNTNYSEASVLIRRCFSAEIFIKRKDILLVIFSLGVKHSLFTNDMFLLTYVFKKIIAVFNNYNFSHYFFYLMNFFVDPLSDASSGKFLRNIRRYHMRSFVSQKIINIEDFKNFSEEDSSNDKSLDESKEGIRPAMEYKLDFLCLFNSFLCRSVFRKTYKVLDEITQPISLNAEILKWIIYILACKSRNNQEKNKIVKRALAELNNLMKRCDEEQKYVILYNIGKIYDMLGFIGYAERYYKDAYQTKNRELKKMCQLNLILIYKKSGNVVLQNRYYDDDF